MSEINIENKVKSIRSIESQIEDLGIQKKGIDAQLNDLKSQKEALRTEIEQVMNDTNSVFANLSDGTEISIRNGIKSFEWSSDDDIIKFLKSMGKFESMCTVETVINKKKIKSLMDDLYDCDGLPDFVTIKQEKVMQIRSTPTPSYSNKPQSKPSHKDASSASIDDFDDSALDGI